GTGEDSGTLGLDAVEGAGAGEALELPSVEQARVNPGREILEAGEMSPAHTFLDQRLHCFFTDALERAQCVADRTILDGEGSAAGVDVRRQAFDAAAPHV